MTANFALRAIFVNKIVQAVSLLWLVRYDDVIKGPKVAIACQDKLPFSISCCADVWLNEPVKPQRFLNVL